MLLLILRIQPSEIAGLDMEDYWHQVKLAERVVRQRQEQSAGD